MNINEIWNTYYDFSGRLSNVCRELNFAGIAIIWVFCHKLDDNFVKVPIPLVIALLFFALSFLFDLLQYMRGARLHRKTALKIEAQYANKFDQIGTHEHNYDTNDISPIDKCIDCKIWLSIVAYIIIVVFVVFHLSC